jgi:hypothetical protein
MAKLNGHKAVAHRKCEQPGRKNASRPQGHVGLMARLGVCRRTEVYTRRRHQPTVMATVPSSDQMMRVVGSGIASPYIMTSPAGTLA